MRCGPLSSPPRRLLGDRARQSRNGATSRAYRAAIGKVTSAAVTGDGRIAVVMSGGTQWQGNGRPMVTSGGTHWQGGSQGQGGGHWIAAVRTANGHGGGHNWGDRDRRPHWVGGDARARRLGRVSPPGPWLGVARVTGFRRISTSPIGAITACPSRPMAIPGARYYDDAVLVDRYGRVMGLGRWPRLGRL